MPVSALFRGGNDPGELAAPALGKGNSAVYLSEKGVVPAAAHIETGMNPGTPLAHNDGPGLDQRTAGNLNT
jgi:hypothetical protein